jgi:sugar lactone lactonase YvrE
MIFINQFIKHLIFVTALLNIPLNAKWTLNANTIAGGHGKGHAVNQLNRPRGLYVDNDQTIYIADFENSRIVEWKAADAKFGEVVGDGTDQLNHPTDVIVDKETDSLIICDYENRRVVRWSRPNGLSKETLIDNIDCNRLTMDDQRFLYVSDWKKDEVRRYRVGETEGEVVAGGNGKGDGLNQLNCPTYVFVDQSQSVYVSDNNNHRVMKWVKGAEEGIIVAGSDRGKGSDSSQLSHPQGLVVDSLGTIYVAEGGNHRLMRWHNGVALKNIIVGGHGKGEQANQLNRPEGLSFDRHGNLYVVDFGNERVQRFNLEAS